MESLLQVIMVCGKQVLVLRAHRDDHIDLVKEKEQKAGNSGNFIELVSFRAKTDNVLQIYFASAPKN